MRSRHKGKLSYAIQEGAGIIEYRQIKHKHFDTPDGKLAADSLGAAYLYYAGEPLFEEPLFTAVSLYCGVDLLNARAMYPPSILAIDNPTSLLTVLINLNDFYNWDFYHIAQYLKGTGF
jgi:hypothetical protein